MSIVTVLINKCVQNSQELGTNEEHMVSQVLFDIECEGQRQSGLSTIIKQAVGAQYNESYPLEVERPRGYTGVFNYDDFREGIERFYRTRIVGPNASGISIGPKCSNIVMYNNIFTFSPPYTFSFDAISTQTGW